MSHPPPGQQPEMQDESMRGTLATQAAMIWPRELPLLERLGVLEAKRIADLGCGTGEFAGRLAAVLPATRIVGLDLFAGHLAHARRAWTSPNLEFVQGDAAASPFPAASFDVVAVRHLLHALPDPGALLEEARRILEPGGLLYVLAEDYQTLLFDTEDPEGASLFGDAREGALRAHTDLHHGRRAWRDVTLAGFERVTVDGLLIDTTNSDRETFGAMLGHWRDGYAAFLARGMGVSSASVRARFDQMIQAVRDPARYACWLLFAVAGRAPAASD